MPPVVFTLSLLVLFVLARRSRTAPAERGETGGDPPFCHRWRGTAKGGCQPPGVRHRVSAIPLAVRGGRSRLYVSLQEGSPARTRAGRQAATSGAMLDRLIRAFLFVGGVSVASAWTWPGAFPEADPVAVLVRYHTPNVYRAVVAWYYLAPGVAVFLAGQFLISSARIWFARMGVRCGAPRPAFRRWPLSPSADGPAIVVGEVHHPVRAIESPAPEWPPIPERGLYTGVAILGAVGSPARPPRVCTRSRTNSSSWQADNPERRAPPLVLEVKGDFLPRHPPDAAPSWTEASDYIELSSRWPADVEPAQCHLARFVLARLHGRVPLESTASARAKNRSWQQAYTNLVRWIIELYRVLPGGWVTLRDVYHCAIDKALFAKKIQQAQTYADDMADTWITVPMTHFLDHNRELRAIGFTQHPADEDRMRGPATKAAITYLETHKITHDRERVESTTATEIRLRVEAVHRWLRPRLEHPRQQDPVEHRWMRWATAAAMTCSSSAARTKLSCRAAASKKRRHSSGGRACMVVVAGRRRPADGL